MRHALRGDLLCRYAYVKDRHIICNVFLYAREQATGKARNGKWEENGNGNGNLRKAAQAETRRFLIQF